MKLLFIMFLVVLTLAELLFTCLYYALTFRFDEVPVIGLLVYLACVAIVSYHYHSEALQASRRELLDQLPG
jgi:hypothetical protein